MKENSLLTGVELFYPSGREWMWSYCVYLGGFTVGESNYDLGIWIGKAYTCAAIVYGDEPGNYMSGKLELYESDNEPIMTESYKAYMETIKRARILGLYK